jgi:cyanophycin synthetase
MTSKDATVTRDKTDPQSDQPDLSGAPLTNAKPGETSSPIRRQRMEQMKLRYLPPMAIAADSLEPWKPVLVDDQLPQKPVNGPPFPPDIAPVATCMQMVLDVARHLLLAASVPCFEPMRLTRCTPGAGDDRAYLGEFDMPVLENYRPGTHQAAISSAISLVNFMHGRPLDDAARQELFKLFEDALPKVARGNWPNKSTISILQGAYELGVPFHYHGAGVYRLGWGVNSVPISRSTSLGDSAVSARLSLRKHITARLLRDAGLPGPEHRQVYSAEQAREAGDHFGWPVVVKPSDLDRGEGVHIDVQKDQIGAAYEAVVALSPNNEVLVERQVPGVCHRLFMANGKLVYAVKRLPMGVRGDGKKTVAELVEAEYEKQLKKPISSRTKIKPIDDVARACLAAAGLSETTVLEPDQYAPLRHIQNNELGGLGEDLTDVVHPENLRIAAAAAEVCGMRISGIDIITEDVTRPWWENGAILNEVNLAPAFGGSPTGRLHLHTIVNLLEPRPARIPVTLFVGDARALDAAEAHAQARRKAGVAAFLTTDQTTTDDRGDPRRLADDGLHSRLRALVLCPEVEELIAVVQNDALLDAPLPLEGIDAVHFSGGLIQTQDASRQQVRHDALADVLTNWVWPNGSSKRDESTAE